MQRLPAQPIKRAYVEITNLCNLRCDFCPQTRRPARVMTLDEFHRITHELRPLVTEIFLHLMGEPLLHPELAGILSICARHDLKVNLVTNGVLLDEERRSLALAPIVRQVNISLHSYAANGGDAFGDAAVYGERVLSFARAARAARPDLYVNLRCWNLAEEDPCASLAGADHALQRALVREFGGEWPSHVALRRCKQIKLDGRIYLHCDTHFVWPSLTLPEQAQRGFCHGLSGHFGVLADGTVVPCCLDKDAVIALGNVHQTPLQEILSGARAERMRAGFSRGELVEPLCQRCPFIARFRRKRRSLPPKHSSGNP